MGWVELWAHLMKTFVNAKLQTLNRNEKNEKNEKNKFVFDSIFSELCFSQPNCVPILSFSVQKEWKKKTFQ